MRTVDHTQLLEDMRSVAEGRKPSDEWEKALGSDSMRGGSRNYDLMAAGISSKNYVALLGPFQKLEEEVSATHRRPWGAREFLSFIYEEWSLDGVLLGWEYVPDEHELVRQQILKKYLRQATVLWAYMSLPSISQANSKYRGPGGCPASMRAKPFEALGEWAANYTFCRIAGLDPKDKRKRPRVVDYLLRVKEIFTPAERFRLWRVISEQASLADHHWALSEIEDVRPIAPYRILRLPRSVSRFFASVVTFWPEGVMAKNTANCLYTECTVNDVPATYWIYSRARVRESKKPESVWQTEVVGTTAHMDGDWYQMKNGAGGSMRVGVPADAGVTVDLFPDRKPEISIGGMPLRGPSPEPEPTPTEPTPPRKRRGWFDWFWDLFS